jgi:hypothetical protein
MEGFDASVMERPQYGVGGGSWTEIRGLQTRRLHGGIGATRVHRHGCCVVDRKQNGSRCPGGRHAMAEESEMKVGVFIPIGNNGWLLSENTPQYMPTFDLNKEVTLKA